MFSSLAFAIMSFKQFSGFAVCSPSKVRCRHGEVVPVTVTDAEGARHSIDVRAESTFDAAHLYVATARSQQAAMLPSRIPVPTVAIVFEVGGRENLPGSQSRTAALDCQATRGVGRSERAACQGEARH